MENRHTGQINLAGSGSGVPVCPECGIRMIVDEFLSTRLAATSGISGAQLFICKKCNKIRTLDENGKPFTPSISTR